VRISAAPSINEVSTRCSEISGTFNDYGIVAFMSGDHLLHMAHIFEHGVGMHLENMK